MSTLTRFFKKNKVQRENTKYAATKSLTDENGNPLEWTIKPLTSRENEAIRDECTDGDKFNFTKYKNKVICASIVEPCLNSTELLESYDVYASEDLILEMIDDPGEFNKLSDFIFNFNNFGNQEQKIEEVKN